MRENQLSIVVPIFNEADALPLVLPFLVEFCQDHGWPLILVNDGSTDTTKEILNEYQGADGVSVFHHPVNRGYGGALKTGILNVNTIYTFTLDADGQHRPQEIEPLLQLAEQADADHVVGSRVPDQTGNMFRSTGKWLIRTVASFLMPLPVKDLNSGFKLFRTELAQKYLDLCPDTMAFSDIITLIFVNQRHLVLEHPITIDKRIAGKSTINILTAYDTFVNVLDIAMMFNPLRIFLPLSFLCVLAGVGWGLPIVLRGRGVSVGSILAIVSGLIFFLIGLIASQLSALRLQLINNRDEGKQ